MTAIFKRRLRKPLRPIKPAERIGRLWDEPKKGRDVSVENVGEDIEGGVEVFRQEPQEIPSYVRNRVRSYMDEGPDINQPVPLTPNPYRRRRKR